MVSNYFILIFCLNLATVRPEELLDSSTLVAVSLFTRHGARSPIISAPSFLFQRIDWGVKSNGDLTSVGKLRMFKLGKKLGEKYKGFLSPSYIENEVHVMSTPCERTENSAISVMAGIYDVPETKLWQERNPVPNLIVKTDHAIDKSSIVNSKSCTRFRREQDLAIESARKNDKGFQDVYYHLSSWSGRNIKGMFDIFPFFDNLECLAHNGLALPKWSKGIYPEKMSKIQAKVLRSMIVGSDKMVRLTSGPYLKELHKKFKAASLGKSNIPKLWYHSGHDFSMTANLAGLGIYEKLVLPGDALVVELHNIPNKGFFVQVLYISEENTELIRIKDCEQLCPLSRFIELTRHFIPKNWRHECNGVVPRL